MRRLVLLTCIGTRGDVQPFVVLGRGLLASGYRVVVAAHLEFKKMITTAGLEFGLIGASMGHHFRFTEEGRRIRNTGGWQAYRLVKAFYKPQIDTWFEDLLFLYRQHSPDLLVLSLWPWLSGGAVLPSLCGQATPIVIIHLVPATKTAAFLPPTAGRGFSCLAGWCNKSAWQVGSVLILQRTYASILRCNLARHGLFLTPRQLSWAWDEVLQPGSTTPVLYLFSPTLLPKPLDWPPNHQLLGCLAAIPFDEHSSPLKPRAESLGNSSGSAAVVDVFPGRAAAAASDRPLFLGAQADCGAAAEPASAVLPTPQALVGCAGPAAGAGHGTEPAAAPAVAAPPSSATQCQPRQAPLQLPLPRLQARLLLAGPHPWQRRDRPPRRDLPASVRAAIGHARADRLPLVYIGFGSMLGVLFEARQVSRILAAVVTAIRRAQRSAPFVAIVQTALHVQTEPAVSPARLDPPGLEHEAAVSECGEAVSRRGPVSGPVQPGPLGAAASGNAAMAERLRDGAGQWVDAAGTHSPSAEAGASPGLRDGCERGSSSLHSSGARAGAEAGASGPGGAKLAGGNVAAGGGKAPGSGLGRQAEGGIVCCSESVPHDELFPYCTLVVHHGGIGTTQATMAACVPQLVVPCLAWSDQPFWGDLLHRKGLGPKGFPISQLTPKRLSRCILRGLQGIAPYRAQALQLGKAVGEEDSLAKCIAIMTDVMHAIDKPVAQKAAAMQKGKPGGLPVMNLTASAGC